MGLAAIAGSVAQGCSDSSADGGAGGGPEHLAFQDFDVLLVIDNSTDTKSEHDALERSMASLINGLVNPPCVDDTGAIVFQPDSATFGCETGRRAFAPARTIHVGAVSSSLGALGSNVCGVANDAGRLIHPDVAEVYPLGFASYDLEDGSPLALVDASEALVRNVTQVGCGYEMPLEAAYRFLADPAPYETILIGGDQATLEGTDDVVLAQREAFLRPASTLVVLVLSDENDCSFKAVPHGFVSTGQERLAGGTASCASNPGDACCRSCSAPTPSGCSDDPCQEDPLLSAAEDNINFRCFHTKQRFGEDLLYPTARYANAFSSAELVPSAADLAGEGASIPNPIFASGRSPEDVYFLSMAGVPWQAIAVDATASEPVFQSSAGLNASGAWDSVLGDPTTYVEPTNPWMIESVEPRKDVPAKNDINGGDHAASSWLQYACLSELEEPKPMDPACTDAGGADPSCEGTTQIAGRAAPGLRELDVARQLGAQGVVGSACAAPKTGYEPSVTALLKRLSQGRWY